MSLVAYEGSSDEEEENGQQQQEPGGGKVEIIPNKGGTPNGNKATDFRKMLPPQNVLDDSIIFSKLPEPKQYANPPIPEAKDEFLKKKEQPTEKPNKQVKINAPAFAPFNKDDDEKTKKKKLSKILGKASGLLAFLPPPKGTPLSNKSFVPNVLTKKPAAAKQRKQVHPKRLIMRTHTVVSAESDDDEATKDVPETFDEETWQKVCAPNKKPPLKRNIAEMQQQQQQQQIVVGNNKETATKIEIAPETPKPYEGLDNDAFKQLVGSTKRRRENIKLIDINEEEVLPEKELWLTKSITDPNMVPPQEVDDAVNDTCRRKHHITYLAQQVRFAFVC